MSQVASASPSLVEIFPVWTAPVLIFSAALIVALRAAAWFTRLVEDSWETSEASLRAC